MSTFDFDSLWVMYVEISSQKCRCVGQRERFPLWMCPPGCLPGARDRLAAQQRPQLLRHPQSRSGNTGAKTEAYQKEQES